MSHFVGSEIRRGVRTILPIAVGDMLDGAAFGSLAVPVIGHIAPIAMSVTAFSGSAQFATISVLRAHGTIVAALLAAAALNARYLALSAALTREMTGSRWRRAAACLLLTDAAWAVAGRGAASGTRSRLIGAGATELVAWSTGTVLGVVLGGLLANTSSLGLDAAFPAFFLWLLGQHVRESSHRLASVHAAVIGAVVAVALTPVLTPGLPVLCAGLIAAAWGLRR